MAIKKPFAELHAFLEANGDKKVKTIMEQLTELCSAKGGGGGTTAIHRGEDGAVIGILDYYFKKWLPIAHVEFGSKANSASGLNTMCKLGTSLWTKQQRDFKQAKETLLDEVASGAVAPTEIEAYLERLEVSRKFIADYPVPEVAFDSVEDMVAADDLVMAQAVEEAEARAQKERDAAEAEETADMAERASDAA